MPRTGDDAAYREPPAVVVRVLDPTMRFLARRLGLGLFHLFGKDEIGRITLEVRPADVEGA